MKERKMAAYRSMILLMSWVMRSISWVLPLFSDTMFGDSMESVDARLDSE